MAGLMGTVLYIADDATVYKIRMDASNATIAGMATFDPATPHADLPRSIKPRYRLLRNPNNGRYRKIVAGDVTDSLWTSAAGTVQALFDYYTNASADYTMQGKVGEVLRAV